MVLAGWKPCNCTMKELKLVKDNRNDPAQQLVIVP